MSSSTGTAGEPRWVTGDAPSLSATFNELSEFALKRGGLLRGTTAERNAFTASGYAREGDHWYDASLDALMLYNGTTWVGGFAGPLTAATSVIVESTFQNLGGWIEFYVAITRSAWNTGPTGLANLETAFRPDSTKRFVATMHGPSSPYLAYAEVRDNGDIFVSNNTHATQTWTATIQGQYRAND